MIPLLICCRRNEEVDLLDEIGSIFGFSFWSGWERLSESGRSIDREVGR